VKTKTLLVALAIAGASIALGACTHQQTGDRKVDGTAQSDGLLAVGTAAPDFSVVAHDGKTVTLSALRGRYVVLYFYPRDDTSGCTKEACSFRDAWGELQARGVVVLGVSTQDNQAHREFAAKHALPFQLLPDTDRALTGAYHVPVTLTMAKRVTYLIGPDGKIAKVWPSVTPVGHAREILDSLPPAP
jgi:peroxiredoxin Q/BCP